jgi:hypothetical protein
MSNMLGSPTIINAAVILMNAQHEDIRMTRASLILTAQTK